MRTTHRLFITFLASALLVLAGCNSDNTESEAAEHVERSQVYAEQGQYRSAMIELRNAIQKDPANVEHVVQLADILLIVGGARQASDALEAWAEAEPNAVALTLATAYMQQGKHISAREALDGFSPDTNQERATQATLLADSERLLGNHDQAMAGYRQALDQSPNHAPAITGMARSQMDRGQYNDALSTLDTWLREFGNEPNVLYLKGLVHYQLNELDSAVTALTDANTSVPQSDMFLPERRQILGLLSRTLTEQGDLTQAMVYNNILSENTDTELSQTAEAAMDALRSGDLDTARATLEELIQRNPDSQLAALLLGAVTLQQGDLTEGAPLLTDNIDAEVTPVPFIRMAAMAQIDQGKRNEALATLERALLARPTDADLLAMHGVLALADPQKASEGVVSLTKALQIDENRSRLRLALAQYHLDQGQPEQALGQLRAAYERTPADWPVTDFYLSTLLRQELNGEARQLRDDLADRFAEDPNATMMVAMTDFRTGDRGQAIQRLQSVAPEAGNYAMAQMALGRMQAAEGRTEAAITAYLNAAEANPASINALQDAGRLYARTSTPTEVAQWLDTIAQNRPELADNAGALSAQIRLQQGELDAAEAQLAALTANNPYVTRVNADLMATRARNAAQQQNWAQARSHVAEAISLQPNNVDWQLLLVRIAASEGQTSEATSLLDDLEADFGRQTNISLTRALVLRASGDTEGAYRYLQQQWQATADARLLPDAIALAGQVAPQDGIGLATAWTEQQPQNPVAWLTLGDWTLNQGNEADAEPHYRQVLQLQPSNILALNNLAWVLRDRNTGEATELARQAAELAPENPAILDTYGWVLHRSGNHQQALEMLDRALALDPGNPDIEAHRAQVQTALQQ
ncbi:MAG: tetratricopeptide repeat protein [Saccharospirillum sp.]